MTAPQNLFSSLHPITGKSAAAAKTPLSQGWRAALLLLLCSQFSCSTQPAPETALRSLTLLHINDTHSHFDADPATVKLAGQSQPLYTYIGGHGRVATLARQWRQQAAQQAQPLLFLHGGDAFKGSGYFEEFGAAINSDMLNRLQLDAMALGNHEFDLGVAQLASFARANQFPLLAANLDSTAEPALPAGLILPYVLFEIDPQQRAQRVTLAQVQQPARVVAVFGLALQDMKNLSTQTGALQFQDEIASARQLVAELKQHGIERVIALTHLGHQRDLAIAAAVDGIDVIVGGHSHSLLGDFSAWGLGVQPPYAEQIRRLSTGQPRQSPACVVQAGQFAQALGKLELEFDPQGQVSLCQGENTLLASADFFRAASRSESERLTDPQLLSAVAALPRTRIVAEAADIRQRLDQHYKPAVEQRYGPVLAIAGRSFMHVRQPGEQGSSEHGSELAPLVADSLLQYVNRADIQAQTGRAADIALVAAGSIRSSLAAGAVREGHVLLEILPYQTSVSLLTVSGKTLKQLLQQTIAATIAPGAHSGKFPYAAGLRYQALVSSDGQLSFSQLEWLQQDRWLPIEDAAQYRLATTQYLADGNDGWGALAQAQLAGTDRIDLAFVAGQLQSFPLQRLVQANAAAQESSAKVQYQAQYQPGKTLDCQSGQVELRCGVQNQALLDYIRFQPERLQQLLPPMVTFRRQAAF
jgi:5'-nucleotidase